MKMTDAELIHVPTADELPRFRGYVVRHPAPPELAISPGGGKWNELRYKPVTTYETSEARKRRENGD